MVTVSSFKASQKNQLKTDPVTLEIVSNRLEAIGKEMGITLLKTAHTSIFCECQDFSVSTFTYKGELLTMGQFIPHHQGGVSQALQQIVSQRTAEEFKPGDVYIINDSYLGGTHPQDLSLLAPIFVENEMVGFSGCTAHQIDIGGMTAGGYAPKANSIYQEGIRFPGIKLVDEGTLQTSVLDMFIRAVRLPYQQRGDILAQLATVRRGTERIAEVAAKYGAIQFKQIQDDILDHAEVLVRAEIEKLPDGVYEAVDYIDHDGHEPRLYRLCLKLTIAGSDIHLDFAGTDDQAPGFINASFSNTVASCWAGLMLFLDPSIPRNHGFFRPISVSAPEGCLFNPRFPAPISGSTTEGGGRVYDLLLQALSKAQPERGIGTWSMMWSALFFSGTHPKTGEPFIHNVLDGLGTGGGARASLDGWHASCIASSNSMIPNVEVEEENFPVRYLRRELKTDTGGPGQFRGGCALETEILVEVDCLLTAFTSRKDCPPPGIFGGHPGGASIFKIIRNDGTEEELPQKVADVPIRKWDRVILRPGGGGGYGEPYLRDRNKVREDLKLGFISLQSATDTYQFDIA
jgi:N-methylhydantoinase B